MKRLAGESFDDYKVRRKGENLITKGHLRGKTIEGMYVDVALHRTMNKAANRQRFRDQLWGIGYIAMLASIVLGVVGIAMYFSDKAG